jgi:3',5'-nucleoside bisphosphate phosphatase
MSKIDLHMHSKISTDGEFSPEELMKFCRDAGVKVAAVSDHNSIRGVAAAAIAAKEMDIELITSVELDCHINGTNLHVLGYGIDIVGSKMIFDEIEQSLKIQEKAAGIKRLALVQKLGILVDKKKVQELANQGIIEGEMIAEAALKDKRNADNELLKPFRSGGRRSDNPYVNFYWDICAQGKPAYAHIEYRSLQETVSTIKAAGGIAVLAHPGNNIGEDEGLLKKIIATGICGIEVFSSYHTPHQTAFYKLQAEKHHLLMTAGSDFHGRIKPSIHIGGINTDGSDEKIYKALKKAIKAADK